MSCSGAVGQLAIATTTPHPLPLQPNQSTKRRIIMSFPNGYILPFSSFFAKPRKHTQYNTVHTHIHASKAMKPILRTHESFSLSLSLTSFPFGPFVPEKQKPHSHPLIPPQISQRPPRREKTTSPTEYN